MRTTITLSEDVTRAVQQLRDVRGIGVSEAVNELIRRGLATGEAPRRTFRQKTSRLGAPRVPLDDIAAALDVLERDDRRE